MFAALHISYDQANAFTRIVLDYLSGSEDLKAFYSLAPSVEGFRQAIQWRQQYPTNREILVQTLQQQYENIEATETVRKNIRSLLSPDTFTVCTAHQPNL